MSDELLKVLDMSEDEQRVWLSKRMTVDKGKISDWSLADLAFRLRDEIIVNEQGKMAWFNALFELNEYIGGSEQCTEKSMPFDEDRWMCYYGKPIHFIITALKAMESK